MPDSLEKIAHSLGGAVVAPGLGHAELVVAALVAFVFVLNVLHSVFAKGEPGAPEWWERR